MESRESPKLAQAAPTPAPEPGLEALSSSFQAWLLLGQRLYTFAAGVAALYIRCLYTCTLREEILHELPWLSTAGPLQTLEHRQGPHPQSWIPRANDLGPCGMGRPSIGPSDRLFLSLGIRAFSSFLQSRMGHQHQHRRVSLSLTPHRARSTTSCRPRRWARLPVAAEPVSQKRAAACLQQQA